MIAAERARQVEAEGYSPEHDDEHDTGDIARAAACYAMPERLYVRRVPHGDAHGFEFVDPWPWERSADKRGQRREGDTAHAARLRELAKAGALIAAEIDRLLRTGGSS